MRIFTAHKVDAGERRGTTSLGDEKKEEIINRLTLKIYALESVARAGQAVPVGLSTVAHFQNCRIQSPILSIASHGFPPPYRGPGPITRSSDMSLGSRHSRGRVDV